MLQLGWCWIDLLLLLLLLLQTLLLGALESDTDTSHIRLRGLRKKLSDVIKRSRTDRQLCLILALSVLLVVVTLIAIA